MTIRELRKLKYSGKVEKIKVAENLYVYVQKESKVFKFVIKKDKKKIEATIDNIDNITLTEAKQIVQKLKARITDKSFSEAREIVRAELAKKQSKKDKEIIQKKLRDSEKYLLKNIIQEYYNSEDKRDQGRIRNYILPALGELDVRTMQHTDIINKLLKNIHNLNKNNKKAQTTKNKAETAKELMRLLRNFYKFLFLHYNITNNPVSFIDNNVIEKVVGKNEPTHFRAITNPEELQKLYKNICELETYEETNNYRNIKLTTKSLMQFLMLTALRYGTASSLKWEYVNWKNKIIDIPKEITKTKIDFKLPLAEESLKILKKLYKYDKTKRGYIFKNGNGNKITESSVNKHLKKLSDNKTTSHGFRSSFATILKEQGENPLIVETQLMHKTENNVAQIYTRTDYVEQRRRLLEKWESIVTAKNKKDDGLIRFDF